MGFRYNPLSPPDPALWLSMDEQERMAAVLAWHEASTAPHPPVPRATLHAAVHTVVENQAAADDPAAVRATLDRLQADGLDRHAAVHAVASVAGDALSTALSAGANFDAAAYEEALAELKAADWRF